MLYAVAAVAAAVVAAVVVAAVVAAVVHKTRVLIVAQPTLPTYEMILTSCYYCPSRMGDRMQFD